MPNATPIQSGLKPLCWFWRAASSSAVYSAARLSSFAPHERHLAVSGLFLAPQT